MKRTIFLLLASLLAGSWSGGAAAQAAPTAPPNTSPTTLEAKAAVLLQEGRTELASGHIDTAEKLVEAALVLAPPGSVVRKSSEDLLDSALAVRRQMVQLDDVERLLDERAYKAASSSLAKLVPEA